MTCETYRAALSAIADDEEPGIDRRLVDAHLASCASCRVFVEQLDVLRGRSRISEARRMPDLAPRVVKLNAVADRAAKWGTVRALLGLVAVEIIVLSVPELVLGQGGSTSAHAARHLGAFSLAYAVGLLVVVIRPARARAMLPVAMVLTGALFVTAVIDVLEGRIPLVGEAEHLPELLSVAFIWMLARPAPITSIAPGRGRDLLSERLRLVDLDDDDLDEGAGEISGA